MQRHALSTNMCKVPPDARKRVCMCVSGNIIANKYLLPVAGSINIKEKLPKNWKLGLLTMREELLYSYCRFPCYFKRLYRKLYYVTRTENSVKADTCATLFLPSVTAS